MAVSIRKILNNTKVDKLLNEKFTTPYRTGYVEVGKDNVCLPIYYQDYEERLRKFEVFDDDVIVAGLAKTGTTWCHELIWLLVNNLDYEGAKVDTTTRCPMLEVGILYDLKLMGLRDKDVMELFKESSRPRTYKTHLNWNLWPEQIQNGTRKPKIISLYRNPKDTCVSHFHQARATAGYTGTFEEFSELYLNGRVPYGPYWKYMLSFWEQRHRPNVLFVRYEEMKQDFASVIRKTANFIEKPVTENQIEKLVDYLSVTSMRNNPATNKKQLREMMDNKYKQTVVENDFVRAGKVGDYASLMTPELSAKFDAWTEKNIAGTGFVL